MYIDVEMHTSSDTYRFLHLIVLLFICLHIIAFYYTIFSILYDVQFTRRDSFNNDFPCEKRYFIFIVDFLKYFYVF